MSSDEEENPDDFLKNLGVFREFPLEPSQCSMCGSRSQSYILRCFSRFQALLIFLVVKYGRTGNSRDDELRQKLFVIPAIIFAPFLETTLNIINHELFKMKIFLSFIGILACLILPVWIVVTRPADYNPLAQVLMSIMLAGFSVWFGIALSSKEASKEAALRWLPAAETAVKQLITISFSIQRMRAVQQLSCENQESAPSKKLFELQCKETSEKLATIRDMIDNATATWEVFIANNCERTQCMDINGRVEVTKKRLKDDLAGDFPQKTAACLDSPR